MDLQYLVGSASCVACCLLVGVGAFRFRRRRRSQNQNASKVLVPGATDATARETRNEPERTAAESRNPRIVFLRKS